MHFIDSELSPIWTKMAGITVHGPLFNTSWTDDQSLIRRPRRFRVKPSLTRDLIWTALVQQKLRLNRGQGQIWTWFKLDRRSNLGTAEPGSTLIVDLNQVQVVMRSTNVKVGSADVVQLNHDGYTPWTLIGPVWSRLVTSHVLFTLVLIRKSGHK